MDQKTDDIPKWLRPRGPGRRVLRRQNRKAFARQNRLYKRAPGGALKLGSRRDPGATHVNPSRDVKSFASGRLRRERRP